MKLKGERKRACKFSPSPLKTERQTAAYAKDKGMKGKGERKRACVFYCGQKIRYSPSEPRKCE
jgi:hypothetical protein